jgi:peptidoglycan/xylan/chitin deacetylase (PgdA/CDA1 family)
VVGNTVAAQRDLALRLIEGGHLLGNHNEVHERAQAADARYTTLAAAQTSIHAATGRCPAYFRPPFGAETQATKVAVRRAGMRTVLWDVEVADWSETDANRLAANVLERLRPGSIVLLHDGADGVPGADRSVLLRALPTILGGIEARGWRAVRVDTLLNESGYLDRC